MPRNALLVTVPYDGLSVSLESAKGLISVPVTEGHFNFFDGVFAGNYTVVVRGNTDLRTFPLRFAGDFSTRMLRLSPNDLKPRPVAPVLAPEH